MSFTAGEYVEQIRRILANQQAEIRKRAIEIGIDPVVIDSVVWSEDDIVRQMAEYHAETDDQTDTVLPFDASHICYLYDYLLHQKMCEQEASDAADAIIQGRIDTGQSPWDNNQVAWRAEQGSSVLKDPNVVWEDDSPSPVDLESRGPRMIDQGATELVPVLRYQVWGEGRRLAAASEVQDVRNLLRVSQQTFIGAYAYDVMVGHILTDANGAWEVMKDDFK
jgi:hypothetical protein